MEPAMHYLLIGGQLGYDPSSKFDTTAYLEANPDVARKGVNALWHYLRSGRSEGRETVEPPQQPRPSGDDEPGQTA